MGHIRLLHRVSDRFDWSRTNLANLRLFCDRSERSKDPLVDNTLSSTSKTTPPRKKIKRVEITRKHRQVEVSTRVLENWKSFHFTPLQRTTVFEEEVKLQRSDGGFHEELTGRIGKKERFWLCKFGKLLLWFERITD
ncbi:unnamed protein product [Ilex paraguariensis]|uniref:Uncharacterized protein n=1 Tax=Ilex paraguariensis TaxID=185542 RepID=A0ABC8U9P7_9AQUA